MASMTPGPCGIYTSHVNSDDAYGTNTAAGLAPQKAYSAAMRGHEKTAALLNRIEKRLSAVELSQTAAEHRANSTSLIKNIRAAVKAGRQYDPGAEKLQRLAPILRTTVAWLMDGEGPEELSQVNAARAVLEEATLRSSRKPQRNEPGHIREIDIHAGMGGGGVPSQEMAQIIGSETYADDAVRGYWVFPDHALRSMGLDPLYADVVPGAGDSMEPDIRSGDWCVVDRRHRVPSPDGIYALWDGISIVFKSLQLIPNSNPIKIKIISNNTTYKAYDRLLDEVAIIGRVVSIIRKL